MSPAFLAHLQHSWPLTVIAIGLLIYLPTTLFKGVFHTNQGRILKAAEPARYWKWVLSIIALDLACVVALLGSFLASSK